MFHVICFRPCNIISHTADRVVDLGTVAVLAVERSAYRTYRTRTTELFRMKNNKRSTKDDLPNAGHENSTVSDHSIFVCYEARGYGLTCSNARFRFR
jgi:hypothetical protein